MALAKEHPHPYHAAQVPCGPGNARQGHGTVGTWSERWETVGPWIDMCGHTPQASLSKIQSETRGRCATFLETTPAPYRVITLPIYQQERADHWACPVCSQRHAAPPNVVWDPLTTNSKSFEKMIPPSATRPHATG